MRKLEVTFKINYKALLNVYVVCITGMERLILSGGMANDYVTQLDFVEDFVWMVCVDSWGIWEGEEGQLPINGKIVR